MLGLSFQFLISLCWPCGSVFNNTFFRYFVKIYLILRGRVGPNCLGHCYWKQISSVLTVNLAIHSFDTKRSKLRTSSLWQPDFVILCSENKWEKTQSNFLQSSEAWVQADPEPWIGCFSKLACQWVACLEVRVCVPTRTARPQEPHRGDEPLIPREFCVTGPEVGTGGKWREAEAGLQPSAEDEEGPGELV